MFVRERHRRLCVCTHESRLAPILMKPAHHGVHDPQAEQVLFLAGMLQSFMGERECLVDAA